MTTSPTTGLSTEQAAASLRDHGPNELPTAKPKSLFRLAAEVLREPMLLLLVATGALYLVLGDLPEALALIAAVFLVVGITLYQQQKTERTLQSLRDLSSPRALVIRNGVAVRIAGREVVPGDIVLIGEGDRIPADAAVISSQNLRVDESLLTGESVPVAKSPGGADPLSAEPHGHAVYSGTLVVSGSGVGCVVATGTTTHLGQIGSALSDLEVSRTSLQTEVSRIVRVLAVVGMSACVMVAVLYAIAQHRWIDGALAGLTMAISMVPEEFPVVLTIFLALGAWRISNSRVLTRRLPAIETLGSTTVLCVDKTGTLTQNRMAISAVSVDGDLYDVAAEPNTLPDRVRRVVQFGALASKPRPTDPMERAFFDLAESHRLDLEQTGSTLVREYPLTDSLLAVTNVWRDANAKTVVAVKGAPEAIADLCRLSAHAEEELLDQVQRMGRRGLRVLAVARCDWESADLPESVRGFPFVLLGMVGLADPVRPGVPGAVRECRDAGIRVVMLTGDYPATALTIASQVGLGKADACLTGSELTRLDDATLRQRVRSVDVFARVAPHQKLRLVTAFKANGEVVAMTGDGVNDAPALKAADVGIAMGSRGTDVAREAAALVLLDDDFTSIVRAARLGRQIYDNIRKAMAYVLAIHVPIAGISLIPVLLNWPLVLLPVHVVFMEMIVDPACSIAFEREPAEADVMKRPPRNPAQRLFERHLVMRSLLQGLTALLIVVTVLAGARSLSLDVRDVRTLTFTTLITTNLALIFTNRSMTRAFFRAWFTPNRALWWLIAAASVLLAAVLAIPPVREVFQLARPHWDDLIVCSIAAVAAMVLMDLIKLGDLHVRQRRERSRLVDGQSSVKVD